jgi:hypothetical protein
MKPVKQYLDYRVYLHDYYGERRAEDDFFSYRFMARKVGMDHSYLVRILQQKVHMAEGHIGRFAAFCGLKGRDAEYFKTLVHFNKSKNREENGILLERLSALAGVQVHADGGASWTTISEATGSGQSPAGSKPWAVTDLSLAAFNKTAVKIRFSLFNQFSANAPADWYVDDIRIYTPMDNEPPYFSNTTVWKDGAARGPFKIQSTITDKSGIKSAVLNYRLGSGSWVQIPLTLVSGDLFAAEIPAQSSTGRIAYFLEAVDNWSRIPQNAGAFPVGSNQNTGFISFNYGTTGIMHPDAKADFTFHSIKSLSGVLDIKFSVTENMRVKIAVFDWSGRKTKAVMDQIVPPDQHSISYGKAQGEPLAPGIYFMNFMAFPTRTGKSSAKIGRIDRFIVME